MEKSKGKRVDTLVTDEVYVWTSTEAARRGISRRKLFSLCLEYAKNALKDAPSELDKLVAKL